MASIDSYICVVAKKKNAKSMYIIGRKITQNPINNSNIQKMRSTIVIKTQQISQAFYELSAHYGSAQSIS